MADYAANISVNVKGQPKVKELEDAVTGLTANLSKLTRVAVDPFKGQISALKQINKLLVDNAQLLNKISQRSVTVKGGSRAAAPKVDVAAEEKKLRLQMESLEILGRQVNIIREAAKGSGQWSEVMQKLVQAQVEMQSGKKANLTLIRTLLRNAQSILREEKAITGEVSNRTQDRSSEVNSARNVKAEIKELRAFESDINSYLRERKNLRKKEEDEINRIKKNRDQAWQRGTGALSNVGGKVDDAFGNVFSGGLKALEGGAVRGAVAGLGILGAQAATAASNFSVLGNSMDFLQGPIGATVQAIAELTGQWGLAAVAAAAFAPLLPTIGKGIVKGLPAFGQLGKALSDVTGLSERAKPALDSVGRSIDTLMGKREGSFLSNGLFGLGPNEMKDLKFPDLNAQLKAANDAFDSKATLSAIPKAVEAFGRELQKLSDRMNQQRQAAKSWNEALLDGKEILEDYKRKTREAAQALMDLGKAPPITAGFGDTDRELQRLEALRRKMEELNRARTEYYGTSNRSRQEGIQNARDFGTRNANVPALKPAGYTDEDVRIANANPVKRINDEIKRTASLTGEVRQSWLEALQFMGKSRYELGQARVIQAVTTKQTQISLLNSKLRLEYFKKQNAELEKQKGLYARIARQVAKGMDMGGPEGLKQGKQKFGENLALGVGFPLLFGGGPGSVVGSGIGSLFGEGFGGQILGGAIGQILDQAFASAAALGNALMGLNIDSLLENGIAFTAELQTQVSLLKKAGDLEGARKVIGNEIYRQTGDMDGDQLQLAAGSVNELGKAWNGLMTAAKVALGTLLAPFVQALTLALRGIQALIAGWNMLVSLVGKAGKWLLSLVGVNSDELYEKTRKNTAEYEKQNRALQEQIALTARVAELQAARNVFDSKDADLDAKLTNGVTQSDKEYNQAIKYEQELNQLTKDRFLLREEEKDAIKKIRDEQTGKVDQKVLDERIDAEKIKYEQMYEELAIKRRKIDAGYIRDVEKMLNQRAQLELKQAEAAQALRRRAANLDRSAEDLRISTEQTILQLRRQGAAIETQATELRESVQDRIYQQQLEIQRMQLDVSRRREQLAINEYQLAAQARRQVTGAVGEQDAFALLESTQAVVKLRAEAEADIRSKNKELAIKIAELEMEAKKFEMDLAKKIEKIKQAAADYEVAAAQAELRLSRSAHDLKLAAADYAVAKRKEEIALMEEAAARIATSQLAQNIGGAYTNTAKEGSSSEVKALVQAANDLGVSSKDLATIISYETGGKFDPDIRGGTNNNYQGLIQFGPEERKKYGVTSGMSFEDQITGPVVEYLKDRFAGVGRSTQGASLSDLYRTVNGGNPNADLSKSDGNGTIAEHIKRMAANHGASASRFMGDSVEITRAVKEGTVQGNEEAATQRKSEAQAAVTEAQAKVQAAAANAETAAQTLPKTVNPNTDLSAEQEVNRQILETKKAILELENDVSGQEKKQQLRAKELQDLQKTQALIVSLKQPIAEIIESQDVAAEQRQRRMDLISQGMLPALVDQTLEIEKQVELELKKVDSIIAILDGRLQELLLQDQQTEKVQEEIKALQEKIRLLKIARGEMSDDGQKAVQNVVEKNTPANRLNDNITATQEQLNKLQDPINIVTAAADEMGAAFSEAFKGVVTGSMSAQEAFGNMTKRMGEFFIDMAMDMLAQYVKLILMQTVLNAIGGPSLGGGGHSLPGVPASPAVSAGWPGNLNYASGGRPPVGESVIVGERGPEVFTPDSAGTISSNRHFDAARDSMSMEADGMASSAAAQKDEMFYETMQSGRTIDVNYDVNVINEVSYVTEEQFQRGMKETAQSARARTMDDLRNYPGKRARVGMR